MKNKIDTVLQILLGVFLIIMGLNKFLGFMPAPSMPESAQNMMGALAASGYMLPLIGITEIVVGILLVARSWAALGLLLLAPLSVNIVLFHLALAPAGILMGLIVFVLNVYFLFLYKPKFEAILKRQ